SRSSNPVSAAMPRRCPPLVMRASRRQPIATCAEPMKHLVPEQAEHRPDHPACIVRLMRLLAPRRFAAGLVVGALNVSGRFRGRHVVCLAPQSKPFFACLECGGLMAGT